MSGMESILPWIGLTLAALPLLLIAEYHGSIRGKWLFKPLAALGFVMTALVGGALESGYGQIMLAGLVLSMAGDVLLIPKGRGTFLAGLVSFLLGHVAYAAAFAVRGVEAAPVAVTGIVLLASGLTLARIFLPRMPADMRAPVFVYGVVITTMVALAVGTVVAVGRPQILIGAVLFYLSDLSVAQDRLLKPSFVARLWGLPFYFVGQLVLAWTVTP